MVTPWSTLAFAWGALALAAVPASIFLVNLRLYRRPRGEQGAEWLPAVSILIPARNEELSIEMSVHAALASSGVDVQVIVLDDGSTDQTASIVRRLASIDSRLRLEHAPPLPAGWCGKQFACYTLAQHTTRPILCFLDADVRLQPSGLAAMTRALIDSQAALISGFPKQEIITPFEQMLLPLMHFLLLGFLPIWRMRASTKPAYAAGCGQIMVVERAAYFRAGGHAALRSSRHDGIQLPACFRKAGLRTDLCDATDVAVCRMYRNGSEVLNGLLKNATEGIAAPSRIFPFSLLLIGGQILPFILLLLFWQQPFVRSVALAAVVLAYLPRIWAAKRFQQPLSSAWLHPISIGLLLAIQWMALIQSKFGRSVAWKGREAVRTS